METAEQELSAIRELIEEHLQRDEPEAKEALRNLAMSVLRRTAHVTVQDGSWSNSSGSIATLACRLADWKTRAGEPKWVVSFSRTDREELEKLREARCVVQREAEKMRETMADTRKEIEALQPSIEKKSELLKQYSSSLPEEFSALVKQDIQALCNQRNALKEKLDMAKHAYGRFVKEKIDETT